MKHLIPYILSYLIVASGAALYAHVFSRHVTSSQSKYVIVDDTFSHDELVAKLQQAGLSEASVQKVTVKPATFFTIMYIFIFDAVLLTAFVVLTYFFRRLFQANVPNHIHDA
jgi:hypothetical protein